MSKCENEQGPTMPPCHAALSACARSVPIWQLLFARNLLADAAYKNNALVQRVRQLERWREVASHVLDAASEPPPPPPPSEDTFGLTRTKEAITKAVKDACELPAAERKRKLKLLKAKWHPDKHEVLKEMAEEVSKMINSCIDEMGGEDGEVDGA